MRESQAENHAIVLMKDQQAKVKMKENADTKRRHDPDRRYCFTQAEKAKQVLDEI